MITLEGLAEALDPSRTVLFLGAGACAASGAPLGDGLRQKLVSLLSPGEDLKGPLDEVSAILELRCGRQRLISAVREILGPLQPTGGIEALPAFGWPAIYTTNYDYIVERSYELAKKSISPIRSNFDFSLIERQPDAIPYFKIHGCLSQDIVDGHHSRIVLTEEDYENFEPFREVVFKRLEFDLMTRDVLVIGYSLRDPHVKQCMDIAAKLHRSSGAPGRIFALIFDRDEERATLIERRGYTVAFGALEQLIDAFAKRLPEADSVDESGLSGPYRLPPRLRPRTFSVSHAAHLESNATRLFNGSPATYADIEHGLTFARSDETSLVQALTTRDALSVVLTGAGGTGKTTLARKVLSRLQQLDYQCFEHNNNFPFVVPDWIQVEAQLRAADQWGVLFLDDCTPVLSQLNRLMNQLSQDEDSHLLVVATAASSQWKPRTKSPAFFTHGETFELRRLSDADINSLIDLVHNRPDIKRLVSGAFASISKSEQFAQLRRRCGADMYVCLKNVFAKESLDSILLREFAELSTENQEVYRLVAALEATGAQVHRQLAIRLLSIDAGTISAMLQFLDGVVDEFDIDPGRGIYGLSTRHRVVAQTIARYKFADPDDRYQLLRDVISNLNPTIFLELRLVREICDSEFGIGSLANLRDQVDLLRQLIALAPGERIPRHRIISRFLQLGELESMEEELNSAVETVHLDPPLARYRVLLLMKRAQMTPGILDEDRAAILLQAHTLALESIRRFKNDPYGWIALGDVSLKYAEITRSTHLLEEAIEGIDSAYSELREPNLRDALRRLRDALKTFV